MTAVGQDLLVEFLIQIAGCRLDCGWRSRKRERGHGDRNAHDEALFTVAGCRCHPPQIADLQSQAPDEAAVEAAVLVFEDHRRVGEPGNDTLGADFSLPADTGMAARPEMDPILGQAFGIGTGVIGIGGAQMPQPAETVQRFVKTDGWARKGER